MMMNTLLAFIPSTMLLAAACMSQMPRQLTDNTPGGQAEPLELDQVNFSDLRSGVPVNLEAYMDDNQRDFLLVTFGSKGCAACNEKSRHLTSDVIGKHPLYLSEPGQRFEIVGVNTDPDISRLGLYLTDFPYIQWSDPARVDMAMLRFFMPQGNKFKVPLTVMISRRGIEWRVMPDDKIDVTEIMARVEFTLGLREELPPPAGDGSTSDDGGDDSADGGGDDGPAGPLAEAGAGRLKSVNLTACDGSAVTLDKALGTAAWRFVQVTKGSCGDKCRANVVALQAAVDACSVVGTTCAAASMTTDSPSTNDCENGAKFRGGDDFFTVFDSHFDWAIPRWSDTTTYQPHLSRAVEGPLVLGFDAGGTLVFSHEGALAAGQIETAMAAPDFGSIAKGPDFPLYNATKGYHSFADLRRQSKITVVVADAMFTSSPCDACEVELKHWSTPAESGQPLQLMEWCGTRPADCQIVLLETTATPFGMNEASYYQLVLAGGPDEFGTPIGGLGDRGIRVPLLLDPKPSNGPTGLEFVDRFYDGYMMAVTSNLTPGGRIFVYNAEGIILAKYVSGLFPAGKDPLFDFVKGQLGAE